MLPTLPLKKVQEPKNFTSLLTLFFGVIYQADQYFGGPGNGGWGNFAQLQKFQVKLGKNGKKLPKNG